MNRQAARKAAVTAVVGWTLATTGAVSAHGPDPVVSSVLFAQNQDLSFRWRTGSEPSTAIKAAIRAAAADANDSRDSKAPTFTYATDGGNQIGYGTGATCGVNGLACFSRSAPNGFTMWLREQGHVFDWGTLKWCQAYASPPNGCYDAETIALDEFGHVTVLDHHVNYTDQRDYEDAVVQTFSRTKPNDGYDQHAFGRCDIATLQREYDVVDSIAKYSTCLDIDTVLTIAGPASVAYDGTATMTAFLEVVDDADYDRLRGNNLSKRTVKLQRRLPGTTDWTTVATMTPGTASGTYAAGYQLRAEMEFRATFASPSSEGLNGDSSPVVTVRVGACTKVCPQSIQR
jgi:hypothetical protein